jgi:O-antigen ligase
LLLVTGSRMGFLLGGVGLAAVPLLYHRPALDHVAARLRRKRSMMIPGLVGGVGVIVLVLLALLFARAGALSRMLATDQTQDLRFRVWGPIVDMTARYLPFGTGLGSFEIIFKLNEPNALLKPTYLNHAHNDWLEIALTGGIGAVALAMVAVAWWAKASLRAWRGDGTTRNVAFAGDDSPWHVGGRERSRLSLAHTVAHVCGRHCRVVAAWRAAAAGNAPGRKKTCGCCRYGRVDRCR